MIRSEREQPLPELIGLATWARKSTGNQRQNMEATWQNSGNRIL